MKTHKIFLCLFLLFFCIGVLYGQAPDRLFQKALFKASAEGDLETAIQLYEQVAADQTADRTLRAKALLQQGICWEKLGKTKARESYQSIINEFADQHEVVAEARTRLSSLEQPLAATLSKGMTIRKVWEGPDVDGCGQVSMDGKYISYVSWDTGDLAIYEIATGTKRYLTHKGSWEESDEFAESANWSKDGKQIVYSWYNEHEQYELRIIEVNRTEPRILFSTAEYSWLQPCGWSKDGTHVLARLWAEGKNQLVILISVDDGSFRTIREFEENSRFQNLAFAPDENYLVYDAPGNGETGNHDIFVYSLQDGRENVLVEHPAHDYKLGWGPNGDYLLFGSDRCGTTDIWGVKVENGKTAGTPFLIKSEQGSRPPDGLGCTKDGLFYYCLYPDKTDVYIMEIDPESGTVIVPPREAINRFVGSNAAPDYSPDGKFLAFISRRAPFDPRIGRPVGNVLCIRSLETGQDCELMPPGLEKFGFPRWSPDSRSVMVVNWKDKGVGHYIINAETGETHLVVKTKKPQTIWNHAWSADGQSVFLVRSEMVTEYDDSTHIFEIVNREIASGAEKILLSGTKDYISSISVSPDGGWLAVLGAGKQKNVRIMPTAGGEPRVIHSFNSENNKFIFFTWSADGKYIFLPKVCRSEPDLKWDLWRIPIDGGEPLSLGLDVTTFWWMSAHPDGRHIAFSNQGADYALPTIWMMENFLPE